MKTIKLDEFNRFDNMPISGNVIKLNGTSIAYLLSTYWFMCDSIKPIVIPVTVGDTWEYYV